MYPAKTSLVLELKKKKKNTGFGNKDDSYVN